MSLSQQLAAQHLTNSPEIKAVLFDLDGTLVDTAPDLIEALNLSLNDAGFERQAPEFIRPFASHGSMAMVNAAIFHANEDIKANVRQGLLEHYLRINGQQSQLFDGIAALLTQLKRKGLPVGIVTNKPARFARPLIHALGLTEQFGCIISGDSTLHPKPHTAPMLLAAQQIAVPPAHILYLGDALRDLQAARNANMQGGIALWGYLARDDKPASWPSEYQFNSAFEVTALFS
ncbi:HAD family hydrolase [Shewanella sp.]|uniref:HAD family hydrolase n=1 Tax=Shewanella sp. TaxID=50422 RepID=UPI0040546448